MLSLRAYAKINLGLSILEQRGDGYHDIESVFQKISLYDEIYIKKTDQGIEFSSNSPPYGKDNICFKVIESFFTLSGLKAGVKVVLGKNIWSGSGLGGASSDAAVLLQGLNQIYGYPIKKEILFEIATSLGSDVPFFLNGDTAVVKGRGEVINSLSIHFPMNLVLVYPNFGIETKWAYRAIDEVKREGKKDIGLIIEFLKKGDIDRIAESLFNDFEGIVFRKYPVLAEIKKKLLRCGCIGASLSGSGSVVYGILKEKEDGEKWKRCMGTGVSLLVC